MDSIISALPYFSWYLLAIGFFWTLFSRAEEVVNPNIKSQISRSLQNLDPAKQIASWPEQLVEIFDSIFGKRHLSWQCFRYSCLASLVSVLIVTLLWWTLRPLQFKVFWESGALPDALLSVYLVAVAINLIPDYLSLIETRWLIKMIGKAPRTPRIIAFLGMDIILNALISLTFIAFSLVVVYIVKIIFPTFSKLPDYGPTSIRSLMFRVVEHNFTLQDYWLWLTHFLRNSIPLTTDIVGEPSPGIWFYSTFFTSVWAWLYALASFFVKLGEQLNIGLKWFRGVFDIENKPLRSLGMIAILLITLLYLVCLILLFLT
ncbi:MAG: hypothetical protein HY578_05830 [Nitrospinae bacterium]|nr:hypothetical protein [Nitrospinota bacterium]